MTELDADSDYKDNDEPDKLHHKSSSPGIGERKKKQAAMLIANAVGTEVTSEASKISGIPTPIIGSDRSRRISLSQHRSADASPTRQRPNDNLDSSRATTQTRKEADLRDLFRLYAASSRGMAMSGTPGPVFEATQLASAKLLLAGGQALSGLRSTKCWDHEKHTALVTAMDISEHHQGWISENTFVREALIRLPQDEAQFQSVVRSCSDALQWVQFQTDTEVVAGIHADRCGSSCDHLPEHISEMLPSREARGSLDEPAGIPSSSPLTEDQRIAKLQSKKRVRQLRHLFRDCDVHHEGVISSSVLLRLAQVCNTLGHRTTHDGQYRVCVCVEHPNGVREIVWSEEHYHQVIKELDEKCNGHITESPFVDVFLCYLPKTDYEFTAVLTQLDAAAKHVRNVAYADQLNQRNHTRHQQEQEREPAEGEDSSVRGAGCVQRGCVSKCSIM